MSKNLNDIRKEIDLIDNQAHDLFMRRAALVSSVAQAKKDAGLQIVHPAREAKLMRRLLSRHEGVLPRSTIVRIWRELISSVSLLQTGLSVVVSSASYWDMAKNYFGSEIPMSNVSSSENALIKVKEQGVYFAVMPWADKNQDNQWWEELLNKDEPLSIVCALPYGKACNGQALIVSKIDFMQSDDDISFIGVALRKKMNRDLIVENSGFEVLNSYVSGNNYLLEVKGFVDNIDVLQAYLGTNYLYCGVIGGYPVIPNID